MIIFVFFLDNSVNSNVNQSGVEIGSALKLGIATEIGEEGKCVIKIGRELGLRNKATFEILGK